MSDRSASAFLGRFANHCSTNTCYVARNVFPDCSLTWTTPGVRVITWPRERFLREHVPAPASISHLPGVPVVKGLREQRRERRNTRRGEWREERSRGKGPPLSGVPLLSHGFALARRCATSATPPLLPLLLLMPRNHHGAFTVLSTTFLLRVVVF